MIAIPSALIDRDDLNLLERALLPLIIRHGIIWGDKPKALSASFLAELLHHSPREVVEALDALVLKKIVKTTREKTAHGVMILYVLEPMSAIPLPTALLPSQYTDSNYYLNLSNDFFEELHAYALEVCDREGLRRELFDDFNLYQRSQNRRSFDWFAEFERWIRREVSSNAPAIANPTQIEEAKPSTQEFEMAQYFIRRLSSIDPQFQEPFDVMSWAAQIKLLSDTGGYSLLEIKSGIDWLFSAKGDWFRPNVPDAYHLRKHFKRLISNTRSFRDGETKLPDGINIFDIIGRE
ncbi:MAG: hypothetical protein PHQ22_02305 [Sulfuricurvum sp.]|nr:hypothetical protein [Sulfuricurvum sp.]